MPTRSTNRAAASAHFKALTAATSFVEQFLDEPSPHALRELVDSLHGAEAKHRRRVERNAPSPRRLACGPGCTPCCHQNVAASAPEVLAIADHLRSTLPAAELAQLSGRIVSAAGKLRGRDCTERFLLREPCPLLNESRCLVYPLRPLACRGDHSLDASACLAAFRGVDATPPPSHEPFRAVAAGLLWGTVDNLEEAGLEAGPLELTQALAIALSRADATDAWLRGERMFAEAEWTE